VTGTYAGARARVVSFMVRLLVGGVVLNGHGYLSIGY